MAAEWLVDIVYSDLKMPELVEEFSSTVAERTQRMDVCPKPILSWHSGRTSALAFAAG